MNPEPHPHLSPTKPSTLVLTALLAAVAGWWLVDHFYGAFGQLPWLALVTMVLLALVEGITARATKARIARKRGTEPMDPLLVARLAALAKASSLGGSLVGGLYAGVFTWVFMQRDLLAAAASDVPVAGGAVASAVLLVAAALWLEYSCRIPHDPNDDDLPD
ncbi:MAG: hypothetical protein QOJ50_2539 [Cryptosporangiaceae bacterium]|nr:hypothetical protein [Cryptosporangiaceae bacterium]